jgi:hypothetical protein
MVSGKRVITDKGAVTVMAVGIDGGVPVEIGTSISLSGATNGTAQAAYPVPYGKPICCNPIVIAGTEA